MLRNVVLLDIPQTCWRLSIRFFHSYKMDTRECVFELRRTVQYAEKSHCSTIVHFPLPDVRHVFSFCDEVGPLIPVNHKFTWAISSLFRSYVVFFSPWRQWRHSICYSKELRKVWSPSRNHFHLCCRSGRPPLLCWTNSGNFPKSENFQL